MLGIVREEPSRQLSEPKDAIYLSTRKAATNTISGNASESRHAEAAERQGASPPPRHQPRPLGKAGREKEALRLAGHQTRVPPPAARTTKHQTPREATDAGAKMPPRPDRARRNAISRRRPHSAWHHERVGNAPNSALPRTKLPSHKTRLREEKGRKRERQLRCGLVGGTTASAGVRRYWWSGSR